MDEKDFKLGDIVGNDKESSKADEQSTIIPEAEKEKEQAAADAKEDIREMADISFADLTSSENNTEKDNKELGDISLNAEPVEQESDSDPIIPVSDKPRTVINDDTSSQTKTNDAIKPIKKSFVRDEEDLKIVRADKKGSSSKKRKKKKAKKSRFNNSVFGGLIIISLILTVSIVIAYNGIRLGMEYLGIGKNSNEITFNVPEGATSDQVITLLQENDIIKEPKLFKLIMKFKNLDFYPGDITLRPSMSYTQIIEALSVNRTNRETVEITFPEGITLREAAALLENNKVCTKKDFIFQFNKKQGFAFEDLIEESDLTFYKMEGYFFPDTYEFYVNDDAYNVARIIKEHFAEKFTGSMESKMKQSGMTLNEVITLASMVQKEAGTVKDMPIVASVFLNRLDDPALFPSLESDATSNYIKYVIKKEADTKVSIKYYTEGYDTYHCKGLPAGPICNPGLDAINAVLNPEQTEYYFFCNNLDTGKAYYAKTNEEHEKNLVKAGLVQAE